MSAAPAARSAPHLSVVIPTYNRPRQLALCLRSLEAQTYPRDGWETIVVIDGDEPAFADGAFDDWRDRLPLQVLRQPHGGCASARNAGAWRARGRYLVFADDDCEMPADWLARYADAFARSEDAIVAGRTVNAATGNAYAGTTHEILDHLLEHFNPAGGEATVALGGNFGVPADGFRAHGGFDARYFLVAGAEDRDFAWRWRRAGGRIVYERDLVARHAHALTFASFVHQHVHYGKGARLFHGRPASAGARPAPEAASFYLSLLARPWRRYGLVRAAKLFALLLVSQAAHAAGYFAPPTLAQSAEAPAAAPALSIAKPSERDS